MKLKTTLIVLLIGVLGTAQELTCFSQELDCEKFRNGQFYYPTLPGKISSRQDSIQESYNNGKLEMTWKVNWLNDCEYEIICNDVMSPSIPVRKGDRILVKIIKTEGDCYTSELTFFNAENPEGISIPPGELCLKKD